MHTKMASDVNVMVWDAEEGAGVDPEGQAKSDGTRTVSIICGRCISRCTSEVIQAIISRYTSEVIQATKKQSGNDPS